jgi:hypothetical protein
MNFRSTLVVTHCTATLRTLSVCVAIASVVVDAAVRG